MSITRRLRTGLAGGSVAALLPVAVLTTGAAAADPVPQDITVDDASALAQAMASDSAPVTAASFLHQVDAATAGVGDSTLTGFPTDGGTFAMLSTGDVFDVPFPGTLASTSFSDEPVRGGATDVTILEVTLDVPTGKNCLAVDVRFLTEETYTTSFAQRDAFIAELGTSDWTVAYELGRMAIDAPSNFAFDERGGPIDAAFSAVPKDAAHGAGTAFDGGFNTNNFGMATPLMTASTPVTPGEHSVFFTIFDQSSDFDTAVFLDNLSLSRASEPGVDCAQGARVATHLLDLAPGVGVAETGQSHTVTATVTDPAGAVVEGVSVEFVVDGSHAATGASTTDAAGVASFTYPGSVAGADTITACVRPAEGEACAALGDAAVTWVEDGPADEAAERISGTDRYGTAAAVSAAWSPGVGTVFLASGQNFPDAMPAGALGGTHDGPVLLTRPDELPPATTAELVRLAPERIVVLGGTAVVDESLIPQLQTYAQADTPDEVTRLAGEDRYATAATAALTYPAGVDVAYVAAGTNFPDALAGAPRAGALDAPVLLTRPDQLPDSAAAALAQLDPGRIVVLGGPSAVGDDVLSALEAHTDGTVTRVFGPDRYGTAASIAGDHDSGVPVVFVAAGTTYPDSLAGAPLAASLDGPLLLTQPAELPAATIAELERLAPQRIVVLGGETAVSEEVRTALGAFVP